MFIHVLWNVFSEIKTSYLILSYIVKTNKKKAVTSSFAGLDNSHASYMLRKFIFSALQYLIYLLLRTPVFFLIQI